MTLSRFDVFIPGDYPEHTYVRRTFVNLRTNIPRDPEEEVSEALRQRGRIVQVAGPSKSGKTIALENVITPQRLITVPGSRITSADALWHSVVAQLRMPVHKTIENKSGTTNEREAGTSIKANLIGAEFGGELKSKAIKNTESGQQVSFEDDLFQVAVSGLIAQDLILFIDDFHTMNELFKPEIAAQIKAAAEAGVKVCLAEVPHRADEPISANPDLTGRIAKVLFEYWSEDDLKKIGQVGFSKLGVEISDSTLVALASEAGGSPQLMQLFCLEAAKALGAEYELPGKPNLGLTREQLEVVFINVVEEVERESILRILDNGPDERGNPRTKYPVRGLRDADNYEITLAAICLDPPRLAFTWDQGEDSLVTRLEKIYASNDKRPRREQITRALDQMADLANKNMPKIPIMDWDRNKGLYILDPYFLFYLRWSEKYMRVRTAS